ncbi:hypothetical protein ACFL20_03090 [Spirochaetota bacterium]
MKNIISILKKRINAVTAYFTVLYFFEIIFFMIVFLVTQGKLIAVIFGILTAIILTAHIISVYFFKNRNRKIQIVLMEIHFAYSISFIISYFIHGIGGYIIDNIFLIVRLILILGEIPLIYLLTDKEVINLYKAEI